MVVVMVAWTMHRRTTPEATVESAGTSMEPGAGTRKDHACRCRGRQHNDEFLIHVYLMECGDTAPLI